LWKKLNLKQNETKNGWLVSEMKFNANLVVWTMSIKNKVVNG
jgi:hypothetical protein